MPTKPKMLYSSTKDAIKKAFDIIYEVQANDLDDIKESEFQHKAK